MFKKLICAALGLCFTIAFIVPVFAEGEIKLDLFDPRHTTFLTAIMQDDLDFFFEIIDEDPEIATTTFIFEKSDLIHCELPTRRVTSFEYLNPLTLAIISGSRRIFDFIMSNMDLGDPLYYTRKDQLTPGQASLFAGEHQIFGGIDSPRIHDFYKNRLIAAIDGIKSSNRSSSICQDIVRHIIQVRNFKVAILHENAVCEFARHLATLSRREFRTIRYLFEEGKAISFFGDNFGLVLSELILNSAPSEMIFFFADQFENIRTWTNFQGYNLLHHACEMHNLEIIKYMSFRGVDLSLPTYSGKTPIQCATINHIHDPYQKRISKSCTQFLRRNGAKSRPARSKTADSIHLLGNTD